MEFIKQAIAHPEVKRGASHLIVGILIGIVSTAIFKDAAGAEK